MSVGPIKVLLVEDNPGDARLLREMLAEGYGSPFELTHAERLAAARQHLQDNCFDVILLDLSLPDAHGLDTITSVYKEAPSVPVVVLTGLDDEEVGLKAVQYGAQDYLIKGQIDGNLLARALRYGVERKRVLAALEQSNKVKSEFLGFVSHELRTPLNQIVGQAAMIQDGLLGEINGEQSKALEKVLRYSHELASMINGLLEATRIGAGAVEVKTEEVELGRFLDELKSLYNTPLEKNVSLLWDSPSDLPSIRTDGGKVKHIVQNLIDNAIKFTEKGSVKISCRYLPKNNAAEFKVADTGSGIPEESLPSIFEMFRQANCSQTKPSRGVGLGLYIVKQFVELLGGKIEADSKLGKGSTFTVTLPSASPSPQQPGIGASSGGEAG
jgi:signal transduction histidine kinase